MLLQAGERVPDFVLPGRDGVPARFYGRAGGRPTALVLLGSEATAPASKALATAMATALAARTDVAGCWIASNASMLPAPSIVSTASAAWVDAAGAVATGLGAERDTITVYVLDANLRVVAASTGAVSAESILALLADCLESQPAAVVAAQAPVLIVPRVVDEDACAQLVAQCRADATETGVEKYRSGESVDPVLKRRRDLTVTDAKQLRALTALVGRRLMPEVERAFAFRATRFEGFKIACYETDSGGFFAAHRDNLTVSTAHRVFGLSINLNDDFAGGELAFPEYGALRYRAPAGAAMVFSCALLHAVHPVVQGTRFVLLSFLYADAPAPLASF